MGVLRVNPTRMVLMDLKQRARSAQRGHKLLKDKQDGLMKYFLSIIREAKALRMRVEQELGHALRMFLVACAWMSDIQIENALSSPETDVALSVTTKNVMSVRIPFFSFINKRTVKPYGYHGTNALLDNAVERVEEVFNILIKLAEIEKQAESIASELETTRRRVNALEHKLIPDLLETMKYIKMKLDEGERSGIIGTMKVKAKIEKQRRL